MIIGYTVGTFDLFHIGHLNMLRSARELCDKLIVGVNSEEYIMSYKNSPPIIPLCERMEIIKSLKCVDEVFAVHDLNHSKICEEYGCGVYSIAQDF